MKYDWYQTNTHVFINILSKGLNKDKVVVELSGKEITINIGIDASREEQFHFDLLKNIKGYTYQVLSTKLEIKLEKGLEERWETLEPSATEAKLAYPTSAKKKVDWTEVEKQSNEIKEGDELSNLFKSIFKDGSEETRRAMEKSFVESGGTCLSTDWSKVGQGKVEITPRTE